MKLSYQWIQDWLKFSDDVTPKMLAEKLMLSTVEVEGLEYAGELLEDVVVAKILESLGINKLIAVDLHSTKIAEAFNVPVAHLSALSVFAKIIKEKGLDKDSATLVSPDMGGIRRIKILSEMLANMPYAIIEKNRDLVTGAVSAEKITGKIGKTAIVVDDMISSGGTIELAGKILKKHGAEEIYVFATHPVFSDKAPKILQESGTEKIYVTDTIFIPAAKKFPKLEILSVSTLIAESIKSP